MSVTSESEVCWPGGLADALAEVEGTATELLGRARGTLAEGTGRGVGNGKAGAGESTHIGIGDSLLQEGGWKETVKVIAGAETPELGDAEVMAECKRPPFSLGGIPKM